MTYRMVVGFLLFAGGAACSSSGSSSGASTSTSFAQQYCALLVPCCTGAGLPGNGQQCEALAAAASAQKTYNASGGTACLSALRQASGQSDFCMTLGGNLPACKNVFSGTTSGATKPGQPCMQDSDCEPATGGSALCFTQDTFVDGGTATTRTCVQTMPGSPGSSPCLGTVNGEITSYGWNGTSSPPTQGYLCNEASGDVCNTTTHTCTALAATGGPCNTDGDCVAADYCPFTAAPARSPARRAWPTARRGRPRRRPALPRRTATPPARSAHRA